MIFAVAIIGCTIFTIYAARLFLRYRSREIGIFMALGAEKKQLSKALYGELVKISVSYSSIGIITGIVISYITLKIFQVFFPFGIGNPSLISIGGILVSVLFSFVVGISMLVLAVTFMKRTNIIDVLNEQRTNESVKYQLTKKYLIIGIILSLIHI